MNPIDRLFQQLRAAKRSAFMPFVTAGDPDLAFTRESPTAAAAAGADLIEVGFPFSDPIADGPVVAASYHRALVGGVRLDAIFQTLKGLRTENALDAPVVTMVSYAIVHRYGTVLALGEAVPDGQVGHGAVGGGTVPVPLPRRAPHGVAGPDHHDVATAGPGQPDALGHVQGLAVGVPVPGGAGAGREVHGVDLAAGPGARGDDVEVHDAGEPPGRSLDRRLRGQDLHVRSSQPGQGRTRTLSASRWSIAR